MRRRQHPFGGAEGGVICEPKNMSEGELERMTRRYTAALIEFVNPDVPAPDMGTNGQIMAWLMDTYSMHMGQTMTSVVTGKPVSLGGSRGRREATGRGISVVTDQALKHLNMIPSETSVSSRASAATPMPQNSSGTKATRSSASASSMARSSTPTASTSPNSSSTRRAPASFTASKAPAPSTRMP